VSGWVKTFISTLSEEKKNFSLINFHCEKKILDCHLETRACHTEIPKSLLRRLEEWKTIKRTTSYPRRTSDHIIQQQLSLNWQRETREHTPRDLFETRNRVKSYKRNEFSQQRFPFTDVHSSGREQKKTRSFNLKLHLEGEIKWNKKKIAEKNRESDWRHNEPERRWKDCL
jgi:hypothetical protein